MDYNQFLSELYSLQDLKYKKFHSKLILADNLIGIRTPYLKKIAKNIVKNNQYLSFFENNKHNLYEENLIHGLILGYLKLDLETLSYYIDEFIPFIDNWAICDLTVSNLKIFKTNQELGLKLIKKYLNHDNTWINRFGYVLLLNYYIEDKYIDTIFDLCKSYKDSYYVKMSIAWLISMCYIKFKDKALKFINSNILDEWTYNKTLQKIIESNRVSVIEKDILRSMKK